MRVLADWRYRLVQWLLRPLRADFYRPADVARLQGEAAALYAYAGRSGHLARGRHARRTVQHAAARIAAAASTLQRTNAVRIGMSDGH